MCQTLIQSAGGGAGGCRGCGIGENGPALALRDRTALFDEDAVAGLELVVLVMGSVTLRLPDELLVHGVHHATFDQDDDRLVALVADDRALQNTPGHGFTPTTRASANAHPEWS